MTKVRSIPCAVALGVLGCVTGCSSSSSAGSDPELTALYAQYTAPTGKLAKTDLTTLAKAVTANQPQRSVPVSGASIAPGGSLEARGFGALKAEDIVDTQACTDGGNLVVDVGGIDVSGTVEAATITYTSCSYVAGSSVSGTVSFAEWSSPKEILIYDGKLSVTTGSTTDTLDLDYALISGQLTWSVTLASGTVLVSDSGDWNVTNDTGSATVTDSLGTWNCSWTATSATCTGPTGTLTYSY